MQNDEIVKEPSVFDFISDIGEHKKYLYNEHIKKNYSQYMINRGFAQHQDTILLANEMNKRASVSGLSDTMHHDFLFYSISKRKRYGKWAKAENVDNDIIQYLQEKYCINYVTALTYYDLYDKADLKKQIEEANKQGGLKK